MCMTLTAHLLTTPDAAVLPRSQRMVLLVLSDCVRREHPTAAPRPGVAFPSVDVISQRVGIGRRAVQIALRKLTTAGWVTVVRIGGGRHATQYRIHPSPQPMLPLMAEVRGDRTIAAQGRSQQRPSEVEGRSQDHPLQMGSEAVRGDRAIASPVIPATPYSVMEPITTNRSTTAADAPVVVARPTPDARWGHFPTARRRPHYVHESAIGLHVQGFIHEELLARLVNAGVPNADAVLRAWYHATEQAWLGREVGEDAPKFWRKRFEEWRGTTAKARPVSRFRTMTDQEIVDEEVARKRVAGGRR
jgi:hypothetical protein